MRFTILTQYYPPEVGAAQVRLSSFAKELRRNGHAVHIVTAMPNYPKGQVYQAYRGKWYADETDGDVRITRTWIFPATGKNVLKRLGNYLSFAVSSLFALMRIPHADILFVESPPLFLCVTAWLVSWLRKQKLCINISDLWPDSVVALGMMKDGLFVRAAYRLEQWLYCQAWCVNAVTEGIVETLANEKGVPRSKVLFLPNGVDVELFHPQTADKEYAETLGLVNKRIFAYTGVHGYAQGLDVIIGAADLLRNRKEIAFLLVGEGPEKSRLQAECQQLSLTNVHFLEAQPSTLMPRIFALTTACIVPLRKLELFKGARPSKLFPPLACSKPVIFCGEGEAAAIVRSVGCGIVVPPEDSVSLAASIQMLSDSPEDAVGMGQKGRLLVESEYSWYEIVKRWLIQLSFVS